MTDYLKNKIKSYGLEPKENYTFLAYYPNDNRFSDRREYLRCVSNNEFVKAELISLGAKIVDVTDSFIYFHGVVYAELLELRKKLKINTLSSVINLPYEIEKNLVEKGFIIRRLK